MWAESNGVEESERDRERASERESRNEAVPDVADNAVLSSGTYQLQKAALPWQLDRPKGRSKGTACFDVADAGAAPHRTKPIAAPNPNPNPKK